MIERRFSTVKKVKGKKIEITESLTVTHMKKVELGEGKV